MEGEILKIGYYENISKMKQIGYVFVNFSPSICKNP
jgi:hypothetical protein